MIVLDCLREDLISQLSMAFSIIKHNSSLFENLYNQQLEDITITDTYNNFVDFIKSNVDHEEFLECIYRGALMGLRSKTLTNIISKLLSALENHKDEKFDFKLTANYSKFIEITFTKDDRYLLLIVRKARKAIRVKLCNYNQDKIGTLITVDYIVLQHDKSVFTDSKCLDILMCLNYSVSGHSNYHVSGIERVNVAESKLLSRDFNILEDIIVDAQVHDSKYSDIIYKQSIYKINEFINRIFKKRENDIFYIHNFNDKLIEGFNKDFDDYILKNVKNIIYGNRSIRYQDTLYHHTYTTNKLYCIEVRGDIEDSSDIFNIKLMEISNSNLTITTILECIDKFKELYGSIPSSYNIMDIMKSIITYYNINDKNVRYLYSPIFLECYSEEIRKWNNKIYRLNDGHKLFWKDDFSKMENVVDEEVIYEAGDN